MFHVSLLLSLTACGGTDAERVVDELPPLAQPSAWVDPFIGTGGTGVGSANTFPGPVAPWGMIQPGPDTSIDSGYQAWFNHAAGYHTDDPGILGFSQTRAQGTSTPDLGAILLMPARDADPAALATPTGRWLPYDHADEQARPGYYAVRLDGDGPLVEITATERAAHYRMSDLDQLVIDLGHALPETEVLDAALHLDPEAGELTGWTRHAGRFTQDSDGGLTTWFILKVALNETTTWSDDELYIDVTDVDGANIGAILSVPDPVEVRVGISYVDAAGARANLAAEVPDDQDFDETLAAAEARWDEVLSALRWGGGDDRTQAVLATAWYHSLVMPSLFQDVDGRYRGLDHQVHSAEFHYHSAFSLWDSYRTTLPLLCLLQPERQRDLVGSLLQMGEDGGYVPRWPLGHGYTNVTIGTSADIVIAETALRGLGGFDEDAALDRLLITASAPTPAGAEFAGRAGIESYLDLGYVPMSQESRSVSRTLEFAIADHALGTWAAQLGRPEAEALLSRGQSYRDLWNPALGVFDGRDEGGAWDEVEPTLYEGDDLYYGGDAAQYAWLVPHDMPGLIELNGGAEAFAERLEGWFEDSAEERAETEVAGVAPPKGYYAGNEPDIHAPWLFLAAGRPDLSRNAVRQVFEDCYADTPEGIPGNDDAGALSSWAVLAALGLYPVAGSDLWLVGAPLVPVAELTVEGGTLRLEAPGADQPDTWVSSVTLNGEPLEHPWLHHAQLAAGGLLRFEMVPARTRWTEETGGLPSGPEGAP